MELGLSFSLFHVKYCRWEASGNVAEYLLLLKISNFLILSLSVLINCALIRSNERRKGEGRIGDEIIEHN